MWRKLLILPPILAGILVVWWFVSQRQLPQSLPAAEEVRNVRVIEVTPVDVIPMVSGFGTVQPGKTWKALVQAAGEVEYVHPNLKRGAILPAGTEIVRISPLDYELAVARAKANIDRAEAQIAELGVSEKNLQSSIDIEKQVLEIRERELERRRQLQASGTASPTALDQETRDTLAQRKKVLDLENQLRLIPTQRAALEQQKKLNELELEQARLNLERTRIALPFDARIAEVSVEASQFAQAGSTLAVADGIETAEVEAQVPLAEFSALARAAAGQDFGAGVSPESVSEVIGKLGFEATIRLNTGGRSISWPARFARISDTVDLKTRSVGVIVTSEGSWSTAVPGERPPLSKGLFVEVEIRANPLSGQIVVPRAALHDGKLYVADSDDRLDIRPVTMGLSQAGLVIIDEGLKPGDRVVVSDLQPAIPRMKLRTVTDEELEASMREKLAPDAAK